MSRTAPVNQRRFRRSQSLVVYWSDDRLAYFDCVSAQRSTVPTAVILALDSLNGWTTAEEFRRRHSELGTLDEVSQLLERLLAMGLVEAQTQPAEPWLWSQWMPEAAFFHFGTRGAKYPLDPLSHEARLREKAKTLPQPQPTKRLSGSRSPLPSPADAGDLGRTLLERRTWRSFSDEPVSLEMVATLLGLTWGVQRRGRVHEQGEVVFKTSPSGGARHPIEAYLIPFAVVGLPPAAYHYDALSHELVKVGEPVVRERFVEVLANQYFFGGCAAVVVMTACFERTMWRYPFKRAYRSILIEAGHLGQTFALLATSMNLAPFQTIAFEDTELENLIGVNGPNESAMYVVGVGHRNPEAADVPGRIPPQE